METGPRSSPPVVPPVGRAFSAGGVIARAISVWFGNFVPFSVVTLAIWAPALLIAALSPANPGLGSRFLLNAVSWLAALVAAGALTFGVLQSLRGVRVPLGTLLETGFAKLGRVFAASFFVGVIVSLCTILLVVPGVIAACGLYVAVPAVVVEQDLGPADAIGRSWSLTGGSRWAIFAVVLVVFVTNIVAVAIGTTVLVLGATVLPHPVPLLFQTALAALVAPLGACAAAVAYHDLRVAKEGVDTALLVKVFE